MSTEEKETYLKSQEYVYLYNEVVFIFLGDSKETILLPYIFMMLRD